MSSGKIEDWIIAFSKLAADRMSQRKNHGGKGAGQLARSPSTCAVGHLRKLPKRPGGIFAHAVSAASVFKPSMRRRRKRRSGSVQG
jgi:hypothetical protein